MYYSTRAMDCLLLLLLTTHVVLPDGRCLPAEVGARRVHLEQLWCCWWVKGGGGGKVDGHDR